MRFFDPERLPELLRDYGVGLPVAPIRETVAHKLPAIFGKAQWATLLDDLPTLESALQQAVADDLEPAGLVRVSVRMKGLDFQS